MFELSMGGGLGKNSVACVLVPKARHLVVVNNLERCLGELRVQT